MMRFYGMGTVTRKSDLGYSSEGKPYIFFSMDIPKQFVKGRLYHGLRHGATTET